MRKFKVRIKEILEKEIIINADSKEIALDMVQSLYEKEDIVLDSNDLKETNIF